MITGFENYTKELNDYEITKLLPAIVAGMKTKIGSENAITNSSIVKAMKKAKFKVTEPRVRKILHIIRVSGMIPGIVGTSKGYYIAQTREEWEVYLKSINERLAHIQSLRDALADQHDNWEREYC